MQASRLPLQLDYFGANIAKMPDLIGIFGHLHHALRQTIVSVCKNKDAPGFVGFCVRSHLLFQASNSGSREEYKHRYDKTRLRYV
jgi:hypothetical protein